MAGRSIIMLSAAALLALAVGIIDESVLLPAAGGTAVELPEPPSRQTPLQQLRDGVPLREISCADGMILLQRDARPACVYLGTSDRLVERGWGVVVHAGWERRPLSTQTNPIAMQESRSGESGQQEPAYSIAPSIPLFADTTLMISAIPRVNETAVLTMTTTLPTYEGIDASGRPYGHVPNEPTSKGTVVGFKLSSHLKVLDLDPRLAEFEVINQGPYYNNRTYLKSMTQLTVTPGKTYVFNVTIQPVREGQIGLSAYGFAGDMVPLGLAIGNDVAMLSFDYYQNNETFLEHLDGGATGSSGGMQHVKQTPILPGDYVDPPFTDKDLENLYMYEFAPGAPIDWHTEYTVQEMVDIMLGDGDWDEDRIRRFLGDVMKVTNEDMNGVSFEMVEETHDAH